MSTRPWILGIVLGGLVLSPIAPALGATVPFGRVAFEETLTSNAPGFAVGATGDTPESVFLDVTGSSGPGAANPFSFGYAGRVITSGGVQPSIDVTGNLTATGLGRAGGLLRGSASGHVEYSFMVQPIGAPPVGIVPLLITASGDVSASGGRSSGAVGELILVNESTFLRTVLGRINTSGQQSFSASMIANFRSFEVGTFTLNASGAASVDEGTATFQAIVDPIVEIDPDFAFRDQFAIVFNTPSVTNPPTQVPEPATVTLLAAGLAAMAARRFRRRAAAARRRTPPDRA